MRRLLTQNVLHELLRNEPARFDLNSAEQCYFYIWRCFRCDGCGKEERFEEALRNGGIGQAAEEAMKAGWYVPSIGARGNMDCSAYCAKCAPAEREDADGASRWLEPGQEHPANRQQSRGPHPGGEM